VIGRNVAVAIVGGLVFLVVAGAVYLEIFASARATDPVWMVTSSVSSGDPFGAGNLKQIHLAQSGENLDYYRGDLLSGTHVAAHDMSGGSIVFQDDVLDQQLATVTLALKTQPPAGIKAGRQIDVYAQSNGQTSLVGRGLTVDSVSGTNVSIRVNASDEGWWITLAANQVPLYVAQSTGVGVLAGPSTGGVRDAILALNGGSLSGPPAPLPVPSPSPRR
jgi:hypothetical protein